MKALVSSGLPKFCLIALILTLIATAAKIAYGETNSSHGFFTKAISYLQPVGSGNSSIKPLVTTNDTTNGGEYTFPRVPDGLGAMINKDGTISVFINHELENGEDGEYAKISKLILNQTGALLSGKLIENGSSKYDVLCSAYLITGNGFNRPVFVTNEEIDNGIVIAYDATNGNKTEMPWLGKFSHENTILVPNNGNKTIMLATEDGKYDHSQLYMYVANSPNDVLHGKGQLYVFVGDGQNITSFRDLKKGLQYHGHFEPLIWDWKTQDSSKLEEEIQNKNGLDFIRLEDLHYDQNNNSKIYVADTGDKGPGQQYKNGRIYSFELEPLSNQSPTSKRYFANFAVILDGDAGDEIRNPDNLATSANSLMIQEDLNDYNRIKNGVNARIWQYDLNTHDIRPVAVLNQTPDVSNPNAGEWESSGIIDVSEIFGKDTWLVDVQAHSINEGGQLLLMTVANS